MNHRPERVGSLIQEELAKLLARNLDFGEAFVTITGVEVNKKLEWADVKLAVIPDEKAIDALKIANKNAGELQFRLSRKLNIKPMPRIRFGIDTGAENAAKVERALLKDEENK